MKTLSRTTYSQQLELLPEDNRRLANLCGQINENLKELEALLEIKIKHRGHKFEIFGEKTPINLAASVLIKLYKKTETNKQLTPHNVQMCMKEFDEQGQEHVQKDGEHIQFKMNHRVVSPKGENQLRYLKQIKKNDINFGVGPAGTGKTYLAVLNAVDALEKEQVKRIVLVRPAVEAGESLGFLPGDFDQKVQPYLRPLYDAMYEMMGFEWVNKRIEAGVIEVVPLAYMRGRTLNDSFIILDEAQNSTVDQMKMFLTRLGFGSKAVITGDVTQVDLKRGIGSGLKHAIDVLRHVDGISFTFFQAKDAVRHKLVQSIIEAYEKYD